MFADQLTEEQRQVVFDLAANLAAADNDVSDEEIQYLKDFSVAYGIEFDLDKSELDINDALSKLDTKKARVITLQELIKLSYKDGHFGKEEQDKVFLLAQKMGLNNTDLLMRIEAWVRQGFDWVYEGEQMLNEE
ncbi:MULTISPECIES: TerB family tellurite resistance protein [Thiomicrorhabdus]|uniref:TerB family tellurite resistance protein n=1 Tax=Thiomicrorhabdus xiamenensis TaxID=2739063 RepID=A0A7D4NQJ9_9GAMM|nr:MULTISPECIES: TerB family tellurite resistance protein [Thiomicrorhabdus]MBO1923618.1 TerB family tellurite resistance protein [Thiomicrorhabdus sp. 6S3-12]QKI88750.1 TerB family tellurite resistance protein [Thiomicrorhabdus xiamenensis]